MPTYYSFFYYIDDDGNFRETCKWGNCLIPGLSGEYYSMFPTISCLSGFEFDCTKCKCAPTSEINIKPLSAFNFEFPDEWRFTVSWEKANFTPYESIPFAGLSGAELQALSAYAATDSYAAQAIARYDARRKNYKVDIVPGSIVNTISADPWGNEKVLEGLRLSTDVFYNQDKIDILLSTQSGGAINLDIEYIKFWFDGESPELVVDKEFTRLSTHICPPWEDNPKSPLKDNVACQSIINKRLQRGVKEYKATIKERKKQGFGFVETPYTRNNGVSAIKDYINESLVLHGFNSVSHGENIDMFASSASIKAKTDAREVKIWRNHPMDENVLNFEDGIVRRAGDGKFICKIDKNVDNTLFIPNGDIFLSLGIDETVQTMLEPGGVLSSYGPGTLIDVDSAWNQSARIPGTVWTEVDLLYSPVYTVLSSISSSYWPTSALSGSVIEPYIDHLNRLYPDEIPAGEVIEPSVMYILLSSNAETLSSYVRINTLSATASHPWWNPSFLTHVSFVSGDKIGNNEVISLAYNKINLNDSTDIGNTTLLTYGNTMIEVNNAYNGKIMGLVLDDFETVPFVVDIDNSQIELLDGYVGGVTNETRRLRQLGFI